ncbi:MAG: hypothetical protein KDD98_03455 [Sphingomonadaceae bacterium]|nr:hypothetical protein [Sphingomonadaceae bacterium]
MTLLSALAAALLFALWNRSLRVVLLACLIGFSTYQLIGYMGRQSAGIKNDLDGMVATLEALNPDTIYWTGETRAALYLYNVQYVLKRRLALYGGEATSRDIVLSPAQPENMDLAGELPSGIKIWRPAN